MIFAIVHYNTPELTTCLCGSIKKFHLNSHIIIFDNSDKKPFNKAELFDAEYLDNTKQQIINFQHILKPKTKSMNNYGSAKHCLSVDYLIHNLSYDDFILLDSDILFTKPIDFIDSNYIAIGTYECFPRQKDRLLPFITYCNRKKIIENNINYFDNNRMSCLSLGPIYDTGASFLEDILLKKLPIKYIDYKKYIIHFKNGSWSNKSYKNWLLENKKFWF